MIAVIDPVAGIAGDMFLAALLDAGAPRDAVDHALRAVGGESLSLRVETVRRAGLRGLHVDVLVDGTAVVEPGGPGPGPDPATLSHGHRSHRDIRELLGGADLPGAVRERALAVFAALAGAEARMHDTSPDDVHFHEVGSWDALADVVGVCAAFDALGIEAAYHGPVAVGGGTVTAAHGALPVPAPATLELLAGREVVSRPDAGEWTTPTGAALLAVLARPLPRDLRWTPGRAGYGAGRANPKDHANVLRVTLGRTGAAGARERVAVVEAALDDVTPEDAGHLVESLLEAGALDATLTPQVMKKSRPGFLVRAVVPPDAGERFAAWLLERSSTLGARWRVEDRMVLDRRVDEVELEGRIFRVKVAVLPDGSLRPHAEFEDLRAEAARTGEAPAALRRRVERAWEAGR